MRCTIYNNHTDCVTPCVRCPQPATILLIDENGHACPGGQCCQAHADSIIQEYQAKIGMTWTTVPIDEYGDPLHQ